MAIKRLSDKEAAAVNKKREERPAPAAPEKELEPTSPEEEQVWRVLEQARQNVKQIAKKELEGEVITEEILNRPLRAPK